MTVHVDGGARGNPGPSAVAAVASDGAGQELAERSAYIGQTTNNVAEYKAVLLGLELARELGATKVDVVNDSELVSRQIEGRYKVKNAGLKPLHAEAMETLRGFEEWSVQPCGARATSAPTSWSTRRWTTGSVASDRRGRARPDDGLPGLHRPPPGAQAARAVRRHAPDRPGRGAHEPAAAELAAPWGERLEVVVGDIGERRLGLTDADWERLTGSVDTVFHLAAIYDLAVPLALAQRVNVDGTGNVIDFCRAATGLRRHVYVSTAYVAGRRRGTVYEHELVLGQDFKNHYESTKFQAEVWVRDSMAAVPTTILRPAIVVGDSQSGETEKFDGPYYLLRAISQAAARDQAPMQFGRSDAPFNVVPVDYVVAGDGRRCHRRRHGRGDAAPGGSRPVERPRPPGHAEPAVLRPRPARVAARLDGLELAAPGHGAQAVLGHPARVHRLPQPPGQLRHPPRCRAAWRRTTCARPCSAITPRTWSRSSKHTRTIRRTCPSASDRARSAGQRCGASARWCRARWSPLP